MRLDHRTTFLVTNVPHLIRPKIIKKEFTIVRHQERQDRFQSILVPRSTFESSQTPYRGILQSTTPSATGEIPVHICTGALVARDERIGSTIPMPTFASRPSTMNSFLLMEIRQSSMDSRDSRYRKFNLTNSPLHHHSYVGR